MEVGFLLLRIPDAVHISHTFKMAYLHLDCNDPYKSSAGCIPKDSLREHSIVSFIILEIEMFGVCNITLGKTSITGSVSYL